MKGAYAMPDKPLLIIVNGLPGAGKTTLARRLAADLRLPVFSRDGIYETLYDALDGAAAGAPPLLGAASFALLYQSAGAVLAAGQPVIVEGFFGRPDLRRNEFFDLQERHDFEPLEILCVADGTVLMERFLARNVSGERHESHQDMEWLAQNETRLLNGQFAPLTLRGTVIQINTTTRDSFEYAVVLRLAREALQRMRQPRP